MYAVCEWRSGTFCVLYIDTNTIRMSGSFTRKHTMFYIFRTFDYIITIWKGKIWMLEAWIFKKKKNYRNNNNKKKKWRRINEDIYKQHKKISLVIYVLWKARCFRSVLTPVNFVQQMRMFKIVWRPIVNSDDLFLSTNCVNDNF